MAICIKKDTYPKINLFLQKYPYIPIRNTFHLSPQKPPLCPIIAILYSRQKSELERIVFYISLLT